MKFFLFALICMAGWLAESWAFMVAAGAVHGSWVPALPTLSYSASLQVNLGLTLLVSVWSLFKGMAEAVNES